MVAPTLGSQVTLPPAAPLMVRGVPKPRVPSNSLVSDRSVLITATLATFGPSCRAAFRSLPSPAHTAPAPAPATRSTVTMAISALVLGRRCSLPATEGLHLALIHCPVPLGIRDGDLAPAPV